MGVEVFHPLKAILKKKGLATSVGDEGGFAPNLKSNEEVLETILDAIRAAGYKAGKQISLALDVAASELHDGKKYVFKKSGGARRTSEQMVQMYEKWVKDYPIVSIEDGVGEKDWERLEGADGRARLARCSSSATTCSSPTRRSWPRASRRASPTRCW